MNPTPTIDRMVSVIVPTHNRSGILRRTLAALAGQHFPADQSELIVVADGCTDDTLAVLEGYAGPIPLRFVSQPSGGAGAARNHGAAIARGRLLVFLDDDVEASPDLIAAHRRAHEMGPTVVAIGYLPPSLKGRRDFYGIALRGWWETMFARMRQPGWRPAYTDLLSGNFSVAADLFHRVGGFDPTLRVHEDYELGLRLIRDGATFVFAEAAMGLHLERTDLVGSLRRKYLEGRVDVQIGRRYPEVAPTLLLIRLGSPRSVPSRLVLMLMFSCPGITDRIAHAAQHLLPVFEWMRMRRRWRHLLDRLMGYWYVRGAAVELASRREYDRFRAQAKRADRSTVATCDVDLTDGVERAEAILDELRPAAATLRYGQWRIGDIPAVPGTENLRGAHLRAAIAGPLLRQYQWALTLDGGFAELSTRAESSDPVWAIDVGPPRSLHDNAR